MKSTTVALVATQNASRYLQQLCKHWSHRFEASFDAHYGKVDFGDSECFLDAGPDVLKITVTGNVEAMQDLQAIVAEHVDRFAHKEAPLRFDWVSASAEG